MAKKLRDITGKGKFAGVNKSKVAPPDINDKNLSQWNSKDGVDFVKKHDTETHEYPYDADAAFKGRKDGGSKTTKYKFQKDGVYEESDVEEGYVSIGPAFDWAGDVNRRAKFYGKKPKPTKSGQAEPGAGGTYSGSNQGGRKVSFTKSVKEDSCNHTTEGETCEVHGKTSCPKEDDVNMQKMPKKDAKGRSYLADKKIKEETDINEVAPPSKKIEKWIKDNKARFVKEYGKEKGTQVLYAKAWKMHGQSESGTATNTDYTGPGAAGYTTGRLDVGTL